MTKTEFDILVQLESERKEQEVHTEEVQNGRD